MVRLRGSIGYIVKVTQQFQLLREIQSLTLLPPAGEDILEGVSFSGSLESLLDKGTVDTNQQLWDVQVPIGRCR